MKSVQTVSYAALALGLFAGPALSAELPKSIAWTAYDVGSAGYSQAVSIGSALKNKSGVTLRVLPGKNDVSRMAPLREGKVHFSATGVGAMQAFEATDVFGTADWGPQKIMLLSMANADSCGAIASPGNAGIRTPADYKGKQLAWVKGAPALNWNIHAVLRFADLTWDDVNKVEFSGYGAAMDSVVTGETQGSFTVTTSGFATKIEASPHGVAYPVMAHSDEAGWKRLMEAAPYYYKAICKDGAGIEEPFEGAAYPYPILTAYAAQDDDLTYAMTKAMFDHYPEYKDGAPGAYGWAMERQVFEWVLPFHPGAIRYYEEQGVWTPEIEAHNQMLLDRFQIIADAWEAHKSAAADSRQEGSGWMKARVEALEAAGLNPIWRE